MYLEAFIFFMFLIIQLVVGLYAVNTRRNISKKYSNALGSLSETGKTVEEVINKYEKYNLKVKVLKNLNLPVLERDNVLYIDKDSIYRSDLYTNYLAVYEIVVIFEGKAFKTLSRYVNFVFSLQLVIFLVSLFLNSNLGFLLIQISIVLAIVLIIFSFIIYNSSEGVFKEVQETAVQVLTLDEVEAARAESLNKDLKLSFLEYSLKPFQAIVGFFKP